MPENDLKIHEAILQKLHEAEQSKAIRIPLAVESGSRSWGFPSPDSDYDCRFAYAHEKDWYISVFEKPGTMGCASDKVYDINGWDLRKFIANIVKSNASAFEWLSSHCVYMKDVAVTSLLGDLAGQSFNPLHVSYHYLGLAKKKLAEIMEAGEAKLKSYFYVLRPLINLKFIEMHEKMPYMDFYRTLSEIEADKHIAGEISRVSELKASVGEGYTLPPDTILTNFFALEMARQAERLKTAVFKKPKNHGQEDVDLVFKKTIELAWRNG